MNKQIIVKIDINPGYTDSAIPNIEYALFKRLCQMKGFLAGDYEEAVEISCFIERDESDNIIKEIEYE